MIGSEILKEIRRRVGDIDGILDLSTLDYTDIFLFELVSSAISDLTVKSIITTVYTTQGIVISPEPSNIDGLLLASWAAAELLSSDIAQKIRSGRLGIRFKSGQDEISTVEAAKQVLNVADRLARDHRQFIGFKIGDKSTGAERVQ